MAYIHTSRVTLILMRQFVHVVPGFDRWQKAVTEARRVLHALYMHIIVYIIVCVLRRPS